MPEIEQEITRYAGHPVRVGFTPHLVPMNRGELVTATVDLAEGASVATLHELLAQRYDEAPFVHLLPEGVAPAPRMVRGSHHAVVNAIGRASCSARVSQSVSIWVVPGYFTQKLNPTNPT